MKRWLISLVVLLLALAATTAFAQTEENPDETYFRLLPDGETLTDSFDTTTGARIYVFNGSAGDVVTISMMPLDSTGLDPYLVLLGSRGEVYAANDDSISDDDALFGAAIEDFELPVDGSYFVLAMTFLGQRGDDGESDDAPYEYEISASGYTHPASVTEGRVQYASTNVEIGASGLLEITEQEPVYYVTFIGQAGDTVNLRTETSDEVSDTLLYLFDNNGVRLAVNDDSDGLAAAIEDFELPDDGFYFVMATSYDFMDVPDGLWSSAGSFRFSLDAAS